MARTRVASKKVDDKRKRKFKRISRISLIVSFSFIALFFLVGFIFSRPTFLVKDISIIGVQALEEEDIQEYLQERMQERIFGTYSRGSALFFSEQYMEESLLEQFPRIERVMFVVNESKVSVIITERGSLYLGCFDRETDTCYFVDEKGFVFAESPYFSGTVFFRWYPNKHIQIEDTVSSFETFNSLTSLADRISEVNMTVYGLEFLEKTYRLYIDNPHKNKKAAYIEISKDFDEEQVMQYISKALATEDLSKRFVDEREKLEYIDLRFESKIFYRFWGDE
ncbi:MAG: hypothetical protein ACI9AR_000574 [Flavobacteriaceae bacterium]|jgi:hypothetical protein